MSLKMSSSASALSSPSRRKSGLKPISKGSPLNGTGSASLASPMSGVWAEISSEPSLKRSLSGAFFCARRLIRRTTSSNSPVLTRSSCSNDSGSSCL